MVKVIELKEEELKVMPEFDNKLALSLHSLYSGRISIEWPTPVNQYFVLTPRGWVGQIPVSDDVIISIIPKVEIKNIFQMLEYVYDIRKLFELYEGMSSIESINELFESLAVILAKRVLGRVRKGLYREYVAKRDTSKYVRGRIRIRPFVLGSVCGNIRVTCEYEGNTADLDDNRILAWTLYQLPRFQFRRETALQQIRRAYHAIAGIVDLHRVVPTDCINRFYNRLNEDYQEMHALCRFFLEHSGPSIQVGDKSFIPFMINMPTLYESFVTRWLEGHIESTFDIKPKYHARLDSDGAFYYDIDLVLTDANTNEVLAVLDTKYKRTERPESSDISQVVAYAARMKAKQAFLVYPSRDTRSPTLPHGDIRVNCLSFDLSKDLDEAGYLFYRDLTRMLSSCRL